jgi:membrane-associated phospholipid phosphatase
VVTTLVWVAPAGAQTTGPAPEPVRVEASTPADATPAAPRPSVFHDLFGSTLHDLRQLPSRRNADWLVFGLAGAALTHVTDWNVTTQMTKSPALGSTLHAGNTLGGARGQLGGALATYFLGRVTRHDRLASVGGELFRAQLITQGLTAGIKMSVARPRPDGTEYSFPSGHTSTSFASATVLQREFGWKAGVPAYAVAAYVAASRVQAKRHYLSDVAFGAALGVLVGRTITIGHGDTRFAVTPTATAGGAGVAFTLVGSR